MSGGTTELLLSEGDRLTCIGGTLDLNAGQLIDRIGVLLGLSFPCGPAMDALCDFDALKHQAKLRPLASVNGLSCNLSGLENKAKDFLASSGEREVVAAFVIASVEKTLATLAQNALDCYGSLPILFSGGVSGNRYLKAKLSERFDASFAEPAFSSDNAAGIAILCEERYEQEHGG